MEAHTFLGGSGRPDALVFPPVPTAVSPHPFCSTAATIRWAAAAVLPFLTRSVAPSRYSTFLQPLDALMHGMAAKVVVSDPVTPGFPTEMKPDLIRPLQKYPPVYSIRSTNKVFSILFFKHLASFSRLYSRHPKNDVQCEYVGSDGAFCAGAVPRLEFRDRISSFYSPRREATKWCLCVSQKLWFPGAPVKRDASQNQHYPLAHSTNQQPFPATPPTGIHCKEIPPRSHESRERGMPKRSAYSGKIAAAAW